jgi:hypothetical protein
MPLRNRRPIRNEGFNAKVEMEQRERRVRIRRAGMMRARARYNGKQQKRLTNEISTLNPSPIKTKRRRRPRPELSPAVDCLYLASTGQFVETPGPRAHSPNTRIGQRTYFTPNKHFSLHDAGDSGLVPAQMQKKQTSLPNLPKANLTTRSKTREIPLDSLDELCYTPTATRHLIDGLLTSGLADPEFNRRVRQLGHG